MFAEYVGIDYSGAGMPDGGCSGLRVFRSADGREAVEERPGGMPRRHWSRRALADWLTRLLQAPGPAVIGIDHCFSFPKAYLDERRLGSWAAFLDYFHQHWRTDECTVETCRAGNPVEDATALRLCDRWTSSAKSVFRFDVNGSVAKSSHAGLPFVWRLRRDIGDSVHFWPFDGWQPPPERHVIAEVYPSILHRRILRERHGLNLHQRDAHAVAEWLRTRDAAGLLAQYFEPGLTAEEREVASVEGWILGVL